MTQYEGNLRIFDTQNGIVYMLDIEKDECTLIKPFTRNRPI